MFSEKDKYFLISKTNEIALSDSSFNNKTIKPSGKPFNKFVFFCVFCDKFFGTKKLSKIL